MREGQDREVERLLREYQQDLRQQTPPNLMDRLLAEQRLVTPQRKLFIFPSRRAMGALAMAASLLIMIAVFRPRPVEAPAVASLAQAPPAPAVPVIEPASAPMASPGTVQRQAEAPAVPSPRPPGLASSQPALPPQVAPAETTGNIAARAEAEQGATMTAEVKRAAAAPAASAGEAHSPVLTAIIVREVWDPGQLARVSEGTYQRLADGHEVRSVLSPQFNSPALAQNSQSGFPLAAPSQQADLAVRRQGSIRDQIADSRSRTAGPRLMPLGEAVIEGFRCVGSRTVDNERAVERWRSPELGLDLLVRTTEANGAQVIVRYTRIERR